MVDEEDLASTVLNFYGASFGYERTIPIAGVPFALFTRRETESEAKFRPKVVRRWVLVPQDWIFFDRNQEVLILGRDGKRPARVSGLLSVQSSDGTRPPAEFEEQGIEFLTRKFPSDLELYLVRGYAARVLSEEGRGALGLPPPLKD